MAAPGHSAPSPVTGSSPRLPAPSPSERGSRRRLRVARGPATRVEGSRPVASCGRRGARVGHATAAGREPPLPCGTSRGRGPRRPLAGVCPSPGAVSFPECHSGGIMRHATPPCWLSSLSRFLHVCARLRSSRPPSPGQCRWRVDVSSAEDSPARLRSGPPCLALHSARWRFSCSTSWPAFRVAASRASAFCCAVTSHCLNLLFTNNELLIIFS